ncbi:MAG: peptidoglycan DD-metalloendopeptidase family protein [Acidimicrobiia bacterium]
MRVSAAIAVVAAVLVSALPAGASQADLDRAQKAANQAAAEYAAAQTQLSEIEGDIVDLEAERSATVAEIDSLEGALKSAAIDQYVRGRDPGPDVDLGLDLAAARRRETLASFVARDATDAVDRYRALTDDLATAERQLADRQREARSVTAEMKARNAAAQAQLVKLTKLEAERKKQEDARRRAATAAASSGVRVTGSWTCPVQGPRAFSNDWGDPRGGGRRRHQGNDILAPRGTPVVANVAGTVKRHDNAAGGVSYYLNGDDGNEYYGAHLASYAGVSGRVAQGAVIGYVGNTGNASGGATHLHFEIHPGGGAAVNPYNTLRQYC